MKSFLKKIKKSFVIGSTFAILCIFMFIIYNENQFSFWMQSQTENAQTYESIIENLK